MIKSGSVTKLLIALMTVLTVAGFGIYVAPRLGQLANGQPIQWELSDRETGHRQTAFEEQNRLQENYAETLRNDIITAVEQITGKGTVQATVRLQLNLETADESYHQPSYRENVHRVAGVVENLSVSVIIDGQMIPDEAGNLIYQARSKSDMAGYTHLIKTIIGFDINRGDQLSVQNIPFVEGNKLWFGIAKNVWIHGVFFVAFLVVILVLIWGLIRPLVYSVCGGEKATAIAPKGRLLWQVSRYAQQHPELAVRVLRTWLKVAHRKNPKVYALAERAAILVLSLGQREMAQILRQLTPAEAKVLGRMMVRLGAVSERDIRTSLDLFLRHCQVPQSVEGGAENVQRILTQARPDGKKIFSEVKLTANGKTIWERFAHLEMGQIIAYLKHQKTETIALILYHLSDQLSGQILALLPSDMSARVVIHMTHIRHIRPAVREQLSAKVAEGLYALCQPKGPSGYDKVAAILKTMAQKDQAHLMQSVYQMSADVGQCVQGYLKKWADIDGLSEAQIRKLLAYCNPKTLARALVDDSPDRQALFARQMGTELWQQLKTYMRDVTSEEIDSARQIILKTARDLHLFG